MILIKRGNVRRALERQSKRSRIRTTELANRLLSFATSMAITLRLTNRGRLEPPNCTLAGMRNTLILAVVFGALGTVSVYADPAAELASARERWAEQGSEHYSFTISNACYCAPASSGPRSVTVVDGEAGPSQPLEPFKASRLRTTIPLAVRSDRRGSPAIPDGDFPFGVRSN